MKKLLLYGIFVLLVGGVWVLYAGKVGEVDQLEQEMKELAHEGTREADEKYAELENEKQQLEGVQTFNGILLAFVSAGVVGIFFVFEVLPSIAHRFTHAVYDSSEMVEEDPLHDARSLMAQGDYDGAIEAFKVASEAHPMNRVPWVEIAKIQRTHKKNPQAAVATLREAIESHEWQMNDAAFFMFRLAEIYNDDLDNQEVAAQILQQVCEELPETRHAANARHKLHEWGFA